MALPNGKDHWNWKHGETHRTKEWRAWNAMIRRCLYPSMQRYSRYGGCGITVCERWRHSFENFLSDMGRAPSASHTLDRIDNDWNYEPSNCRWATRSTQIRNSTKARWITFNGKTQTIGDWARELGINRQTIQMRLDARKWPVDRALGLLP